VVSITILYAASIVAIDVVVTAARCCRAVVDRMDARRFICDRCDGWLRVEFHTSKKKKSRADNRKTTICTWSMISKCNFTFSWTMDTRVHSNHILSYPTLSHLIQSYHSILSYPISFIISSYLLSYLIQLTFLLHKTTLLYNYDQVFTDLEIFSEKKIPIEIAKFKRKIFWVKTFYRCDAWLNTWS